MIWNLAFGDLARNIRWPSTPHPSLGNWDKYYRGSFKDKPVLKRIWRAMPKFICWQIWLTRNNFFFQGTVSPPQTVAAKEKLLLSESMNSKSLKIEDPTKWNVREKDWMASFNLRISKHTNTTNRSSWQLHSILNIEPWIQKKKVHTLCFDGASKGNPGEAGGGGGGGVLFEPGGKKSLSYHWNLGTETNNKVEAYALLKGVQLSQTKEIRELVVLGDSKTIIRMMIQGTNPRDPSLKKIMDRIRMVSRDIKTTFYHILRENNIEADKMANAAIGAKPGALSIDGVSTLVPLY
jgi:ribonuclease HI